MAVTVDPKSKKLVIRFRVSGYSKQFYLSTGLKDTKANKAVVDARWELIQREIALDEFDFTLDRYRFGNKKKIQREELKIKDYDLTELWNKFTDYQEKQLEQTTILNRYQAVNRYLKKLPTRELSKAVEIRDWLLKNSTPLMTSILIDHFHQACNWAIQSKLIDLNPFTNLRIKYKRRKGKSHQAYTKEQRDLIIKAFENSKYFDYTPLIKFLFFTGCRPGEAFALTWGDINDKCTRIKITKSCNFGRITKTTKNRVERVFPTSKGSKLQSLLLEIRPPTTNPDQLIFPDIDGSPMTSAKLQKIWRGQSQKNRPYIGVVLELNKKGIVPYLKPYSTRHTFATLAIASGITPDRVALWIGDTVGTVLKYYCHPEILDSECPDF